MSDMDLEYTQARNRAPSLLDQAKQRRAATGEAPPKVEEPQSFAASFAGEVGKTLVQIPIGIREGVRQQARAVEGVLDELDIPSVVQLTDAEGNFDLDLVTRAEAGETSILFPTTERPEGFAPNLARGAGQFLAGFIGPFKALGRAGVGTGKRVLAAGAIADAFAFDPKEATASEFIQSTGLANPVTEFLATNPDDSEAEQRFKNAIEGALLGKIGEKLTTGVIKAFKTFRSGKSLTEEAAVTGVKEAETSAEATARVEAKVGTGETEVVAVPKLLEDEVPSLEGIVDDIVPEKAVNINLQKLDTTDDIKNVIAKVSEAFEGDIQVARREKITLEQTEKLADDLGMSVEELLQRRQGEAFNAETVIAARKILVASATKVRELAEIAQGTGATAEDKAAFLRAMSTHKAIQQQVSGLTAEAGRALSSFRIVVGRDINVSLENVPVEDMARAVASQDTLQGINTTTRELDKATTGDMLLETWINGLLSGPTTHAVNIVSNAMVNLWAIPDRMLASGFGRLAGNQEIAGGEIIQMLYGMKEGYRDGLKLAWKAIKTGEPQDPLTKLDVKQTKAITAENLNLTGIAGRAADFLGEAIRLPGRFLTAGDELFKSVNYRMELNALAFRQARQEGLEGRAMAARMTDITNNPPANIVEEATKFARVQTFTNELGKTGRSVQNLANSHPAIKLILPFVRTPTNIVKLVGVKSPLAPFAKSVREDIAAGGARRDLALAKMSSGTMIMAAAAGMAGEGRITGGGPANPNLKKILRDTGWQPYSIVIGRDADATYLAYNRLDPVGMTMGMAADYSEISGNIGEADLLDVSSAIVMATAKNLTSKTYLSGLTTFLGAIDQSTIDPEKENRSARRFLERLGTSAIPFTSLLGQTARVIDPTLRDADGLIQSMKARIPGYSADLPARLNMWGEEIILEGGLGPDIISPIYISHGKEADISNEIWNQRLPIGMPSRSLKGVKMSSQEYHDFIKLTASTDIKRTMEQFIKTRDYENLTDGPEGQKATVLRSMINQSREFAKGTILTGDDPEFRDLRQRIREAQ